MGRMSRNQFLDRHLSTPKPKKVTKKDAQGILLRVFKRRAVEAGLIDPSKPKFQWQWFHNGESGELEASTRSEARGLLKKRLGVKKDDRLPLGVALNKVGVVQNRSLPFIPIIGKNKACA